MRLLSTDSPITSLLSTDKFNSWHSLPAARNFGTQLHQTGVILKILKPDPTQRLPYAYGKR